MGLGLPDIAMDLRPMVHEFGQAQANSARRGIDVAHPALRLRSVLPALIQLPPAPYSQGMRHVSQTLRQRCRYSGLWTEPSCVSTSNT